MKNKTGETSKKSFRKRNESEITRLVKVYKKDPSPENFDELYPHLCRTVGWGLKNLRLVYPKGDYRFSYENAIEFLREYPHQGREDLFQAGLVALIKAIDYYDPSKETSFLTVAPWFLSKVLSTYIYHEVRGHERHINLRFSVNDHVDSTQGDTALFDGSTFAAEFFSVDGKQLEWEVVETLKQVLPHVQAGKYPPKNEAERTKIIDILLHYFGCGGREKMTLDQLGTRYGVTRERIRQIKKRALESLRPFVLEEEAEAC